MNLRLCNVLRQFVTFRGILVQ